MMVEPPGQAFVRAVFEIDDRILIAVKLFAVKCVAGTVHRGRVRHFSRRVDLCPVEFSEDRRGRNAVKTIAVIKYA